MLRFRDSAVRPLSAAVSVRELVTDGTDTGEAQTIPSAIGAAAVVFRNNADKRRALFVACRSSPAVFGLPSLPVVEDGRHSSPRDSEMETLPRLWCRRVSPSPVVPGRDPN